MAVNLKCKKIKVTDLNVSKISSSNLQLYQQPKKTMTYYTCEKCHLVLRSQYGNSPSYIVDKAEKVLLCNDPGTIDVVELCLLPVESTNCLITEVYETNCNNMRVLLEAFKQQNGITTGKISDFIAISGNFLSASKNRNIYMEAIPEFELALLHLFAFDWTPALDVLISTKTSDEIIRTLDPLILAIIESHRDIRGGVKSLTIEMLEAEIRLKVKNIREINVLPKYHSTIDAMVNDDIFPKIELKNYMTWSDKLIASAIVLVCVRKLGLYGNILGNLCYQFDMPPGLLLSLESRITQDAGIVMPLRVTQEINQL